MPGCKGRRARRWAGVALAAALALLAVPARAQSSVDQPGIDAGPSGQSGQTGQTYRRRHSDRSGQPHAAVPDLPPAHEAWPRLDPGAVLCRTREAFDRYRAAEVARLDRRPAGADPAECRRIAAPTAVTVFGRDGPDSTEVRLTDAPAETGWTDTYLPAKQAAQ